MSTTRRQFLIAGGATAATVLVPSALAAGARKAPPLRGGRFTDGIASGDPPSSSIALWTRVDEAAHRASVQLEVATDQAFRKVVAHRSITTGPAGGGSVKALVTGLRPHEQDWYRFATRTADSPVGRFRTAPPPGSRQPVRFAYFSCQDYTHGWYNALERMADEDAALRAVHANVRWSPSGPTTRSPTTTSEIALAAMCASSCSRSRGLRDRRHPYVHRRRRAHADGRRAQRRAGVRRRVDHLGGAG